MENNLGPEVLIVHAVDTEGPLYESFDAKFERLEELFNLKNIDRTKENLKKLQNGELKLDGKEQKIKEVLNGHLINYNETWDQIDLMLSKIMTDSFRFGLPDSYGNHWKFTWHCLDHIGYDYNPRSRDIGFHRIFDHYKAWIDRYKIYKDEIELHFHPMSTYKDAHRCATFYFRNDNIYQILSRRIIERKWFPTSFRAGFQTERPDSHWFIEQWFPFDITNMAVDDPNHFETTIDFKNGRSGNWRNAPSDWSIYNPHHDNYQVPGNCRRYIGRALNVMNRLASINETEVEKAFSKAEKDQSPVLMGVTGHDFRNLITEVEYVRNIIKKVSKKYVNVKFRYCSVKEGFQKVIWGNKIIEPLNFEIKFNPKTKDDTDNIIIKCSKGKVFGPQPFLAIETRSRGFLYDNLDFIDDDTWGYAFHADTLPIDDVKNLSIASNDVFGNVCIKKII